LHAEASRLAFPPLRLEICHRLLAWQFRQPVAHQLIPPFTVEAKMNAEVAVTTTTDRKIAAPL
jgi:hypothetical protein